VSRWGDTREFASDDVDDPGPRNRLAVSMGGNGDWYVEVRTDRDRFGPSVRIRTHGGASSTHPGLGVAISRAYRAMGHEPTDAMLGEHDAMAAVCAAAEAWHFGQATQLDISAAVDALRATRSKP
jgi:hypothetical protein